MSNLINALGLSETQQQEVKQRSPKENGSDTPQTKVVREAMKNVYETNTSLGSFQSPTITKYKKDSQGNFILKDGKKVAEEFKLSNFNGRYIVTEINDGEYKGLLRVEKLNIYKETFITDKFNEVKVTNHK